jgi:hypothetical protein
MHFRLRKNVIQLIRITYDDTKKKGNNTIVGTVKLSNPVVSDELRSKLTVEELNTFEAWLNTQHRTDMLREEIAALTLAETMVLTEKWLERETDSGRVQAVAHDIVFQWQNIRRLLIKKGLLE